MLHIPEVHTKCIPRVAPNIQLSGKTYKTYKNIFIHIDRCMHVFASPPTVNIFFKCDRSGQLPIPDLMLLDWIHPQKHSLLVNIWRSSRALLIHWETQRCWGSARREQPQLSRSNIGFYQRGLKTRANQNLSISLNRENETTQWCHEHILIFPQLYHSKDRGLNLPFPPY